MTTNEKRAAIARVYSSESWQEKVAKMSDNQVIAIYQKFLADGKFEFDFIPVEPVAKFKMKITDLPYHGNKEDLIEPDMALVGNKGYKEDFEQLAMDGFIFKKTGKAGN